MIIVKKAVALSEFIDSHRRIGKVVGFVPTMGALHSGHLELVSQCAGQADITIVSIFVNPTQFNDPADYARYPKTLEADILLLAKSPANVLFLPDAWEVYPEGTSKLEHYDLGYLETILEGKYRPGHFQGVAQVMSRLLKMVRPGLLFMGRKDYQQCMVIKKIIDILQLPITLVACPTVREADGLAKSSRNLRLDSANRAKARLIYEAMQQIKLSLGKHAPAALEQSAVKFLTENGFRVDYVQIANASDLKPPAELAENKELVVLVAAFLGDVRLIDNLKLS